MTILAAVWLSLLLGGLVVYGTTRAIMIVELDASLARQAMLLHEGGNTPVRSRPKVADAPSTQPTSARRPGVPDGRFLVRNDRGQTVARAMPDAEPAPAQIVHAAFVRLGHGRRVRTLTLRPPAAPTASAADARTPATIVYSASAEPFDRIMSRLAIALILLGALGAMGAALVAMRAARASIQPLLKTAEELGEVDETRLAHRIDPAALPAELRPAAERFNEMLGRLDVAFTRRKQFFADTSHELRTPIAAMVTTMEVALRRPRSAPELEDVLRRCLADARLLNHLAAALLEQARSESSETQRASLDAKCLLAECFETVRPLADEKQLALHLELPVDPLVLRTDEQRLRSIVMNLLSNAIEYNLPGGLVRLRAQRLDEGGAIIEVQDRGVGISPDDVQQVFEPFFRASKSRSRSNGHLGLGLHLVKTHAAALGGRCEVHSVLGEGSRFALILPNDAIERAHEHSDTATPKSEAQVEL